LEGGSEDGREQIKYNYFYIREGGRRSTRLYYHYILSLHIVIIRIMRFIFIIIIHNYGTQVAQGVLARSCLLYYTHYIYVISIYTNLCSTIHIVYYVIHYYILLICLRRSSGRQIVYYVIYYYILLIYTHCILCYIILYTTNMSTARLKPPRAFWRVHLCSTIHIV
jgi:hypothetical protein